MFEHDRFIARISSERKMRQHQVPVDEEAEYFLFLARQKQPSGHVQRDLSSNFAVVTGMAEAAAARSTTSDNS